MGKLDGMIVVIDLHKVVNYILHYLVQIWEGNLDTPLLDYDEHTWCPPRIFVNCLREMFLCRWSLSSQAFMYDILG